MSLGFLLPAALAGLAALLLPLLLHLARRREARRMAFAAMRWLPAGRTARRRVRIEERALLLVRLLLVAAAVLWLAQPVLRGAMPGSRTWMAAWPGVDAAQARAGAAGADHAVWLAPGFPPLDAPAPSGRADAASLLRELDARLPTSHALAVLLPDPVDGLDAAPLRLSREVAFRVVAAAATREETGVAAPTRVLLAAGEGAAAALPYLRAALAAWRGGDGEGFVVLESAPAAVAAAEVDAVVGVGEGVDLPRDLASLPRVEVVPNGATTAGTAPGARLYRLAWPGDDSVPPLFLDPGLPDWLAGRLRPVPQPQLATAAAVMGSTSVVPPADGGRALSLERDLSPWLALAMALLFALERLLAVGPRLRGAR